MTTTLQPVGAAMDSDDAATEIPVLEFADGIPGFPGLQRFALVQMDDEGLVLDLTSVDDESVRFVVVPSVAFFPDYAPEVPDATATALGLESADEALVVLVLNVGQTVADTTANLRAPIVINTSSHRAAQVVLDDASLPLRARLGGSSS